jgi:hypothetical protein
MLRTSPASPYSSIRRGLHRGLADVAVDDDLLGPVAIDHGFFERLDPAVFGTGEVTLGEVPAVADVEEVERLAALDALADCLGGHFLDHHCLRRKMR